MSFEEHRKKAPKKLGIGVLVVSDSRTEAIMKGKDVDVSGKTIERMAANVGYSTVRKIVPDEEEKIMTIMKAYLSDPKIDAIIITGGTGIAKRDITIETISPMFEKDIPGFGEILRKIGYEKIGIPALLTRTAAGVIKKKPVFCLPGAPNAVEIGCSLILPELGHIVKHARD